MRATGPTMEQSLETLREGEGARLAVNALTGDGRGGDAGPRKAGLVPATAAVGGGNASKGNRCTAGNSVSRQKETREPQDRQRPENGRKVEEENRRGGEKPRGWHAGGTASHPEGGSAATRGTPGRGFLDPVRWRGRSLDNPKRGNPALRPGRKDRNASGKSAPRSGGSRRSGRKC